VPVPGYQNIVDAVLASAKALQQASLDRSRSTPMPEVADQRATGFIGQSITRARISA